MKKYQLIRLVLIRMFTNFDREIVFSADLRYNGANEKPPSEREVLIFSTEAQPCGTRRQKNLLTKFVQKVIPMQKRYRRSTVG